MLELPRRRPFDVPLLWAGRVLVALLPTLAAACDDAEPCAGPGCADAGTDGAADGGDGDASGGGTSYELGDLDETCDGTGLTARGALAFVSSPYAATLVYDSGPATALTITVAHDDGTATCVRAWHAPPGVGAPDTPARVEVEITLGLVTADGAFDDHARALLVSSGTNATVTLTLAEDELGGSFSFHSDLDAYAVRTLGVAAEFLGPDTSGTLHQFGDAAATPDGGVVGALSLPVGTWGE